MEVMCQEKLLTDKSINLPDALIGKQDLNEIQGAMDEHLAKILAEQEGSRTTTHELDIQLANARMEVNT